MIAIQSKQPSPCSCRYRSIYSSSSASSRLCYCAVKLRNASRKSSICSRFDLVSGALRLEKRQRRPRAGKVGLFYVSPCKASIGDDREYDDGEVKNEEEFLPATVLVSETVRHYNLRKQGFFEETGWQPSSRILPLYLHSKGSKSDISTLGHGVLRRFRNPTIFLKVSCDGDLLLPVIVGDHAIERLVDTLTDCQDEGLQDQFKFMRNLVCSLGYEVKMVRIVKRVVNTYYARIFLGKPSEGATLSIDSRPSDAIHLAVKCQAPIYVSKDIVLKDAIKIVYGTWRGNSMKTVYDVLLDSAPEGPDSLAEELDLIKKLHVAVAEERFKDAAAWRDRLSSLRRRRRDSS